MPQEKTAFGSRLDLSEQLYLNSAILKIDADVARPLMIKAGIPNATRPGDDFVAILHTARLNMKHAPRGLRSASEEWLRKHGYPAAMFPSPY